MITDISKESEHNPAKHQEPKAGNPSEIFKLLVDAVEDYAIFALDIYGNIMTWNLGGERLKGYSASEVIGTHFSRFYTQADIDRDHPNQELKIAAQCGKYEEEGWRVRKNGERFWANIVITALRDDDGVLKGFGKVTRDLTTKKNAEIALRESEERFRLMVSSVTDYAIITLDPGGYITSWNAGAERIKGYAAKEILGKHFSSFYPKSEIENGKADMELRIASEEDRYEEEGWRVRKDGTMFWANVTITAVRGEAIDGKPGVLKGFAKVTRDLTSRRQSEEALRESQERYRLLVDNVRDYALILLDPKGRVTSWNAGATRITGYGPKEVLGSHFSKFYSKSDISAHKPEAELRIATEAGRYEEEETRTKKDGTEYWTSVVLTAIKDEYGNIRGFSKVMRDLTEKKAAEAKLRESEERFRMMVDSVDDYAIFMLDVQGKVVTWNKGAERNKGYSADEIIGRHFSTFYPDLDIRNGKPDRELKEAVDFGRFEEEGWRLKKDGSQFWAGVVITPIYDKTNSHIGFAKVTRNLTERKKAEDELRAAYGDLENKIIARTQELSKAKAKAEAAVKARERFFSIASHELKTPLSSLKLQAQIRKRCVAKGDYSDFLPENLPQLCDDDERQIVRLTFLVDNMLDISKLTSGNFDLKLENFELGKLTQDVVRSMDPLLREAGCICTFNATSEVRGNWDRHRVEQIVSNFLTNAAKYAGGKPVEVTVGRSAHFARISVRDYGMGISEENQKNLFQPFERLKNNLEVSGLGLGLYIIKQIIEAHGGQIILQSKVGEGSTFIAELPLEKGASDVS